MRRYYAESLAGERLDRVYELASPRVAQYLEAEIRHVLTRLAPGDEVLELGCGTGRVTVRLAEVAGRVTGIDNAPASIAVARRRYADRPRCAFHEMDAAATTFPDAAFDAVVCAQNGIRAFGVAPEVLLREALRLVRPGGRALFSTYHADFWAPRLAWFEAQAAAGLLGEVDRERSGDGVIVCRDGFRAGLVTPDRFRALGAAVGIEPVITEVDGSCVCAEFVGSLPRGIADA